jgi:hypothetical protein
VVPSILAVFALLWSFQLFRPTLAGLYPSSRHNRAGLARASSLFRELEELLAAGLLPGPERWAEVRTLAAPWGTLADDSLNELRSQGGQVLPTLKRLRALAEAQARDLLEGQARSASALAQALTCAAMVPLLGGALYVLLPGLSEHRALWMGVSTAALAWAGTGALWLLHMAENARWGGLARADRPGLLSAYCASERILALVRSGQPPDLAWSRTMGAFQRDSSSLALLWRPSLWAPADADDMEGPARRALARAGESIRKAIQCSLLEGRPSGERVEAAAMALRQELGAAVERELGLLATRALKPLFFCVAPALFGVLACAVLILFQDSSGGFFGL